MREPYPFQIISDRQPEGAELAQFIDTARAIKGYILGTRQTQDQAVSFALKQLEKGLGAIRVIETVGQDFGTISKVVFTAEGAQ